MTEALEVRYLGMKVRAYWAFAVLAFVGCTGSSTQQLSRTESAQISLPVKMVHSVTPPSKLRLPLTTVFKGEAHFHRLVERAERENWRALPIGERTVKAARAMTGIPYVNYTLEVDDRIENPVVNFAGMDCWTFYENALAFARMLKYKPGPYTPEDMLHMIEIERYRGGRCTGGYLSRMHHLEEVFYDNQRRGFGTNVTPSLPGAERLRREIREMTVSWKSYRYLRNNPGLRPGMANIEKRVSGLPVYHIPKAKVRAIEGRLRDGDICAITTTWKYGYTSHVGVIVKTKGRAYFSHATSVRSKGRQTIVDQPITSYLYGSSKRAGIVIFRPKDLPPSPMWRNGMAAGF